MATVARIKAIGYGALATSTSLGLLLLATLWLRRRIDGGSVVFVAMLLGALIYFTFLQLRGLSERITASNLPLLSLERITAVLVVGVVLGSGLVLLAVFGGPHAAGAAPLGLVLQFLLASFARYKLAAT